MTVSRVKTFSGLLFESIFNFNVFLTNLTSIIFNRRINIKKGLKNRSNKITIYFLVLLYI